MKRTVIGYVAGIIYSDGFEWLAGPTGLASLYNNRESTKIYRTEQAAQRRCDQLKKQWGKAYKPFVRPYILESH